VPVVHPEQVASYLAKYLTKATEDFGLPAQVRSAAHARVAGASPHAVRLIATAQELATQGEEYGRLLSHLGTLGYRGHPITKSRAYSVTFGQIRRARRRYRSNPAGLAPDADIRQLLDDDHDVPGGFELVSSWISTDRATSTSTRPPPPSSPPRGHARDRSTVPKSATIRRSSHEKASRTDPYARAALDRVKETSAFLSIPVGTLYQWHHRVEGPQPYKVGKHLRYDPRAVMRWLDEQTA
jgi:hypothetical protein